MAGAIFDPLQRGRTRGTLPGGGGGGPAIGRLPRPRPGGGGASARPDLSRSLIDPKTGRLRSVDVKQVAVKAAKAVNKTPAKGAIAVAGLGLGAAYVTSENVRGPVNDAILSLGNTVGEAVESVAAPVAGSLALPLAIVAGVALFAYAKGRS